MPDLEQDLIEVEVVWCNLTAGTNKNKNEDDITHEINIDKDKDKLVCFFNSRVSRLSTKPIQILAIGFREVITISGSLPSYLSFS